jgi:hypothetical protein
MFVGILMPESKFKAAANGKEIDKYSVTTALYGGTNAVQPIGPIQGGNFDRFHPQVSCEI